MGPPGSKVLMIFLGLSVISVWSAVIFLFFSSAHVPVTAKTHGKAQIGITENKDLAYEEENRESEPVYAIKDKKAYHSRKISNIHETDDSGKVSIDVLLEELDLN
ncbi:hypothetical protein SAMN04488072_111116 [Lentibacillus halodurans]|uniref:Uncharacterized protein n=1 Tax=Lentibacillus halodurans TaxID=237679 RepID=A0A1I0ZJ87_9BACI|nr:hypothetical protein [Lentibacillus halodurans]SFB25166.1 hypothetical protein SAMN04488072_111116 [Lentibacillus halodurans]